ncbi:MAG: aldo/keto reductase [Oscillospiraceae bacterium]
MKNIKLNNGLEIPIVGLGVFRTEDGQETENAVKWSLEVGYRHIDTAMIYQNEKGVGNGIKQSNVPREEIFLTTKLWNDDIRNDNVNDAFLRSLDKLQTDYVDLYLIHWPVEGRLNAWKEMEKLYADNKIKAIGVSNFTKQHIQELYNVCNIKPAVNQIESHPMFTNQELIDYCQSENIQVQAWSPLGGTGNKNGLLSNPTIVSLSKKYKKSSAQIIIRWNIQRNVIVLPKSVHQNRLKENIDVFDFEISLEDMSLISSLDIGGRIGSDPNNFNF